jgi:hypothetical protein
MEKVFDPKEDARKMKEIDLFADKKSDEIFQTEEGQKLISTKEILTKEIEKILDRMNITNQDQRAPIIFKLMAKVHAERAERKRNRIKTGNNEKIDHEKPGKWIERSNPNEN